MNAAWRLVWCVVMVVMAAVLAAAPPNSVTVRQPQAMTTEAWNEWSECFTDPGWPIVVCEQTVTVDWSTAHNPTQQSYGSWCWVPDYEHPREPEKWHHNTSPYCLYFDRDRDFDVDMDDYAIWQREYKPTNEAWDSGQEVLSFCRHGGCWTVFWHEENGAHTPYLVQHPNG